MSEIKIQAHAITFWLRVKPRAQRDRLKCGASGELILELHAPPVEGEANEACLVFFARAVRVPNASVTLIAGQRSRRKLLRISGRPGEEMKAQILALASQDKAGRAS